MLDILNILLGGDEPASVRTPAPKYVPPLFEINGGRLEKYNGKEDIVTVPEGVSAIGTGAFFRSRAKQVVLPSSVAAIEKLAFQDCTELVKLELPENLQSIGEGAFKGCRSLKYMDIPKSVTEIGSGAFEDCCSLVRTNIPKGLKAVAANTYRNCSSLVHMAVPEGVESIGDSAFDGCRALETVKLPCEMAEIGKKAFYYCYLIKKISIPRGVRSISYMAFAECWAMQHIDIPDTVTEIGRMAFSSCANLNNVVIPCSVTAIHDFAFEKCYSLRKIDVPDSVDSMGEDAFIECPCEREVLAKSKRFSAEDALWQYRVCDTGVEVEAYLGTETSITVPEYIFGRRVVAFGYSGMCMQWLKQQMSIEEITLPESISEIAQCAFSTYANLRRINIPKAVTVIRQSTFANCSMLEEISIPENVERIEYNAFHKCRSLRTITLPKGLVSLDAGALSCCSGLTEIKVQEGNVHLCDIDGVLFNAAKTKLRKYPSSREGEVYIVPDSVTKISDSSFGECRYLKKLVLPEGLQYMGFSNLQSCRKLTEIVANSVPSLGNAQGDISHIRLISTKHSAAEWKGKKAAFMVAHGYAWGRYNGYEFSERVAQENRSYMVEHRREYYFHRFDKDEYLLQCLLDDKAILSTDFETLFEMYSDRVDIIAKLLEYQRANYPQLDDESYSLD